MTEFQALVNKLTNWQRNQWARAGYVGAARPMTHRLGYREEDIKTLRDFLDGLQEGRKV